MEQALESQRRLSENKIPTVSGTDMALDGAAMIKAAFLDIRDGRTL